MDKQSALQKQYIDLRGDIGIAIDKLKVIDEKQIPLGAWNNICSAISYLESVYEDMTEINKKLSELIVDDCCNRNDVLDKAIDAVKSIYPSKNHTICLAIRAIEGLKI